MNDPIGFAVVGTGMIAEIHAQAIRATPEARLVAVYSRGLEKCRQFAEQHGCRGATGLEDLVGDPAIRAVCITTPSGAHAAAAVPLLEAGKAVLCEKPLEVSLEACDRIVAAAERGGGVLAGIFQMRLGRGARLLKAALEAGRFGRLTSCSAYIKWWRGQDYYDESTWKGTWAMDGGGALINQGIHAVDLLQWLVGLPQEVAGFYDTLAHSRLEAEDTVAAALRFPGGALGVIEAATSAYPGSDLRIEIIGDRGTAVLVNDRIVRWEFAEPLPDDEAVLRDDGSATIKGGTSDAKAMSNEGHRQLVRDLALALREGRPPLVPGAEARRSVQLVLAIYEAARTGRTVRLS
ncbi:MAG: UDP-N-acetyl-2-amino-2-deoxyglucuronate dehydrogenase [Chthoniobacter sp.]|jgi:predicted dehydrogenase|nr:UDP-N-acetyl-2-amino-2-deoxyglucuronate dehydrogenase [Chthoniobacter sp.]